MFDYTISPSADNNEFIKACRAVEAFLNLSAHTPNVVDVDGSAFTEYVASEKQVRVDIDFDVDAVYVTANVDLSSIFA